MRNEQSSNPARKVRISPPSRAGSGLAAKVRSVVRLYDARSTWQNMMRADKELGFSLKPDLNLEFPSEGRTIRIKTVASGVDQIGMRDIGTKQPFDAAAIGDSFTFCDDAPADECWGRMLRKVGETLHPRLILVGFFPNDLRDNLHFDNWTRSGTDDYRTWMRCKRRSDLSEFMARHSVLYRLADRAHRYGKRDTFRYARNDLRFTFRADAWWQTVVQQPGQTTGFDS